VILVQQYDLGHEDLTGPRGLGHEVAGIVCVLDRINVGSIPLAATAGASKQLSFDMYLISYSNSHNFKIVN